MSADDSTILASGRTLEHVNQLLANCLKPISFWIENNEMALNVAKTESTVIASKPKLPRLRGKIMQITLNGTVIKSLDSQKVLDLLHDEQLTWNLHIDDSKVLKRINLPKAIKTYLPQCARRLFYKSLIQPIVDYACVIWDATLQNNL